MAPLYPAQSWPRTAQRKNRATDGRARQKLTRARLPLQHVSCSRRSRGVAIGRGGHGSNRERERLGCAATSAFRPSGKRDQILREPAHINAIGTAVPPHEVNAFYRQFAASQLRQKPREQAIFRKLAEKADIERRYSCLAPAADPEGTALDAGGLFARGNFPGTATRMDLYEANAPDLAIAAIEATGADLAAVTHLIVASCTGLAAPGLDLEIIARTNIADTVERTLVGFIGCYAAISALKLAHHIVRSEPSATVLVVNLELCSLHFKETADIEQLLSFCLWGDGCSAAIVSGRPSGIRLEGFHAALLPGARDLMTWKVRNDGFDMVLSGRIPAAIRRTLEGDSDAILGGRTVRETDLWAVHPGGRSVLNAVEQVLALPPDSLAPSRNVLRQQGNMSSATVMFVLKAMLADARGGETGCAMAFGPGLTAETFTFAMA
ncbi:type III polyketide synthase [Acuticoccus sp. MNP-M23]|uniref:type III polyketide synthase n=1 Tax=Acuticoccus sp. MNP-M23 TaxID=3072793 RepID=UPI002815F6E7|nr:type III polyketide synthase [Acuticoccus sp. MNP-M23]WMS41988.1 type III polyketide synthase [Acuticoccus sp. MNP-M23]